VRYITAVVTITATTSSIITVAIGEEKRNARKSSFIFKWIHLGCSEFFFSEGVIKIHSENPIPESFFTLIQSKIVFFFKFGKICGKIIECWK